jgi:hypothetical protein
MESSRRPSLKIERVTRSGFSAGELSLVMLIVRASSLEILRRLKTMRMGSLGHVSPFLSASSILSLKGSTFSVRKDSGCETAMFSSCRVVPFAQELNHKRDIPHKKKKTVNLLIGTAFLECFFPAV